MMRKQQLQLFPYVIARIAGGDLSEFEQTNLNKTIVILQQLTNIQKDLEATKEKLSEELHTFIATVSESKKRNHFIQIRRDMHNEKLVVLDPQIENDFPILIKKLLNRYFIYAHKKQALQAKGETYFSKETVQSKKIFLNLLKKPNFHNGITLSSSTLPESLKKYLHETKSLPKIERSLMKYLSRMYTKPSPFSTFTSLALATFAEKSDILSFANKKITRKSYVANNHFLFHYLIGLLVQNKKVRKHLNIRLNQTIRLSENQFVFLTNNFNREAVQRITQTPALQAIYTFMQQEKHWQYNQLTKQLHTKQFANASETDLESYIDNLLVYGFVEYDLGISGTDRNWDRKFLQLLKPLVKEFSYLAELIDTLSTLRKAINRYEKASPEKREQLLMDTFIKMKQTCLLLHTAAELPEKERASFESGFAKEEEKKKKKKSKTEEAFTHMYKTEFTIKPHTLLYEDTFFDTQLTLSTKVEKNLHILGELLSCTGWFDTCTEQLYELADFFQKHYQPTEHIDLLPFYEDYYREKKEKKKTKSQHSPLLKTIHKRNHQWLDTFVNKTKPRLHDDIIHLNRHDVAHIPQLTTPSSYGAFFHLMTDADAEPIIVINNTVPGFGKMFSRFLPLFPDDLTDKLRIWNEEKGKNLLFAETTDAATFNANIHPSLMPFELTAPGSYTTLPHNQHIQITDIEIVYKKTDNRVHLLHKKTQKEIFAFDLGFQGSNGRSELYGFLSKFTQGAHHHVRPLTEAITNVLKKGKKKQQITILPRIIYENCVVLQRKTWEVSKQTLPVRNPQENDWSYFQRVTIWKKSLALPDEIFIKLDLNKPQYINFTNPFLVTLFEKVIEKMKSEEKLKIEEMLPNSKDLLLASGEKKVIEFLTQWYQN